MLTIKDYYIDPGVSKFQKYVSWCGWHGIEVHELFDSNCDRFRLRLKHGSVTWNIAFNYSLLLLIPFNEFVDRLELVTRKLFRIEGW